MKRILSIILILGLIASPSYASRVSGGAAGGSGSGAPTDATYITQTANGSLSAEQAMGALATGIVKNATTTGIQSIAVADTDYLVTKAVDIVATAPLTVNGGTNVDNALPGADADITWAVAQYVSTKSIVLKAFDDATAVTTGNGKVHVRIPSALNGMDLVGVTMHIYTTSSSGDPTCQVYNLTDTVDMLSTAVSVDATEYDSSDATTPAVIDAANDDVVTGDILQIDVDTAGTGTKGCEIGLEFRLP